MQSSFVRKPVTLVAAVAAAALLLAGPPAARADDAAAPSTGIGVARISLIHGQVAVQRGDSATPTAAAINAPVLGADYVTTGDASRAEVQFDAASSVRLSSNVQMRFTRIDANDRELQLAEGTIDLRLMRRSDAQIDTPSISVRPRAAGSYRVTVDANGATQVTVRSGQADIVTPQVTEVLVPGATLVARGAAASPSMQRVDAIAYDDFDRFNSDRDVREQRALTDAYAPPGVAGVDDLDAYGRWVTEPSYGSVWVPSYVSPGWAPYRDGRWAWEDNYGWTWIGYEPWGWAPYHYGRWFNSPRYGWCWYPARAVVPWSPAIVTFFTFGGIGFGFDTIGWVPLAPFEPFNPWWGYGRTTIVNNTYVTNNYYQVVQPQPGDGVIARAMYKNAQHGGGTEISKQRFLEGRFDGARAVTPQRMRGWHAVRGLVPVVPTDANLRYSERPVAAPLAVRSTALNGTFAGDATVPRRTPIEQQRAAIATVVHAAPALRSTGTTNAASVNAASAIPAPAANNVQARSERDPWSRFGAERGIPAGHHVTVIDGAATTTPATNAASNAATPAGHAAAQTTRGNAAASVRSVPSSDLWKRFDASSESRPVPVHDAAARTGTTNAEPQRTYAAPRAQHDAAPAAPAQPQHYSAPVSEPQHHSAPPAQHTERSTSTTTTHHN